MLQLIASELNSAGFQVSLSSKGIVVSLNRKLSKMEVELTLDQIFEMQFKVSQFGDKVLVQL